MTHLSALPDAAVPAQIDRNQLGRTRQAIGAGLTELGGNLAVKLAIVLQTVVVARLYSPEELGTLATALLIIGAVGSLSTFGLDRYLLSLHQDDFRSQLDVAFTLSLLAGAAGLLVLFAAAPVFAGVFRGGVSPAHVRLLTPLVLGAGLLLPMVVWERQLRYGWTKIPVLLGIGVFVAIAASGRLVWDWGFGGLFLAQLASFSTTAAALWLLAPARPRLRWDPFLVRRQLEFGFPLLLAGITSFLAGQGDDVLVRYFTGDEGLGLYVVAFYLPSYLLALVEMLARVSLPFLAPLRQSLPELKQAFSTVSGYLAAVSIGLGGLLGVFADELVGIVYGDQWGSIVPLVQIFSVAFVLRAATGYHWHTLAVLFGRTGYLMWTSVASAAFMLAVAPALIWKFGLWGGAIYSLLQLGVMAPLVRFPLVRSVLGDLSYLRASVPALIAGSCAVLAAFAVREGARIPLPNAWALAAYMATYAGVLLATDRSVATALRSILQRHG